jgi:hypothetical protein
MPTGVIPDTHEVAVRTRLHMATQGRGATLHDSAGSFADVGRQGMSLLIGRIMLAEDILQREEPHRVVLHRYVKVIMFYFIIL